MPMQPVGSQTMEMASLLEVTVKAKQARSIASLTTLKSSYRCCGSNSWPNAKLLNIFFTIKTTMQKQATKSTKYLTRFCFQHVAPVAEIIIIAIKNGQNSVENSGLNFRCCFSCCDYLKVLHNQPPGRLRPTKSRPNLVPRCCCICNRVERSV